MFAINFKVIIKPPHSLINECRLTNYLDEKTMKKTHLRDISITFFFFFPSLAFIFFNISLVHATRHFCHGDDYEAKKRNEKHFLSNQKILLKENKENDGYTLIKIYAQNIQQALK